MNQDLPVLGPFVIRSRHGALSGSRSRRLPKRACANAWRDTASQRSIALDDASSQAISSSEQLALRDC